MAKDKVVVAMSGGVDSAVSALILKKRGYEVIGVSMKIWDKSKADSWTNSSIKNFTRHACYDPREEDDINDARETAKLLGIPFYTYDLSKDYEEIVLNYFRNEYKAGRTPNPCVICNYKIKFTALFKKILEDGIKFDYFATGHYAKIDYSEERHRYLLKKAKDKRKDQSYFLFYLTQEQLKHILFPLGDYTKEEVREIAKDAKLNIAEKLESQDFTTLEHSFIIKDEPKPGLIVDKDGNKLGTHRGIAFYTIGQRRGLRISAKKPLYVMKIDKEKNNVVVGEKQDVYGTELLAHNMNFISIDRLDKPIRVKAKVRYQHEPAWATVYPENEGRARVIFDEPQWAITPGQAVVFYDEDVVIGGGIIS